MKKSTKNKTLGQICMEAAVEEALRQNPTWGGTREWKNSTGITKDCYEVAAEKVSELAIGCIQRDKLTELFRLQRELNMKIGVFTDGMAPAVQAEWLLNYSRAMQQEVAELVDSVPWKWWAKYQGFDAQNAKVEIVDLFHFLISAAQVVGMSAADLFNAYVKKHEVNVTRQKSGYKKKNKNDSKHI